VSWLAFTLVLAAANPARLPLERITALPSLIGTAPAAPVWSPDGSRLAFLWSDKGMPFRDVWVVGAGGEDLKRATDLGAPAEKPAPNASFEELARSAAARHDPGVTAVVWSGDGKALVFIFHGDLYRVGADGSGLTPLTRTAEAESAPAFSPDGRYLSYLREGDLWLWNQASGENVPVTRVGVPPVGRIPGGEFTDFDSECASYFWSPDGGRIALLLEDRREAREVLFPDYLAEETRVVPQRRDYPGENDQIRRLALYPVAEGRLRPVDLPDPRDRRFGSISWSPDGSLLLVDQTSEDADDRWIYVVRRDDRSARELWHSHKPKGGSTTSASQLWTSAWQSDGKGIVFISDAEGWHRLYALPLTGGTPRPLTDGGWDVTGAAFEGASLTPSPKTRELFFVGSKKSPYERPVYRLPENGGPVVAVTSLAGTHTPFVSTDGARVAVLHSSDVNPTELYVVESRSGASERRITRSPPPEFDTYRWLEPRYVTFSSHVDGVTLHGRLLEPPDLDRTRKHPAILGPVYSNTARNQWRGTHGTFQQYLAQEGYLVLQVDIRGSVGHGRPFRERAVFGIGEIDIEDLESGARYLKSLPYVDAERVGIWGWSYGGLLTAMSLFKKPGVYRAGVAGAPATNVWHATTGEVDLFKRPSSHPEAFRQGSAVLFAEGLRDPLLIIHGMQDGIVLFKDSVTLAEKLMLLGKDFDFVPLPSSVHDAMRRDYTAAHVLRKIAQHFERHLGKGPR
jgi:dipeptidyl-peptidase-4